MRILQLAPRLPFPLTDGGAIGIFNILKGNALRGHDVTLVTFAGDSSQETEAARKELSKFAKVVLTKSPLPTRAATLSRSLFRGAYPIERRMMTEMFELLRQLCSTQKFDIVHVDHSHMGRYGAWLKQEFGIPIVLRQHNFESMIYERFARRHRNPLVSRIVRMHGKRLLQEETTFLNTFDRTIAISHEDELAMRRVAPSAPISVIPAGIPIPEINDAASHPGQILAIGGTDWEPNEDAFEFLIAEIFPIIRAQFPSAELHLVGKGTQVYSAKARGIVGHGRVPDISEHIRSAQVAVIPLRVGGGMRVKLVELLAKGKAVVSTSIGAEGNLAKDGEEILLRDSAEEFAKAVLTLLSDNVLRSRLGENGRELMIKEYSIEHVAERFEHEYNLAANPSSLSDVVAER